MAVLHWCIRCCEFMGTLPFALHCLYKESEHVIPTPSKYRPPPICRKCIYTDFFVPLSAFFGFLSWNQNLFLRSCWLACCQLFPESVYFLLSCHGTGSNIAVFFPSLLVAFSCLKSLKFILGTINLSFLLDVLDATIQIMIIKQYH